MFHILRPTLRLSILLRERLSANMLQAVVGRSFSPSLLTGSSFVNNHNELSALPSEIHEFPRNTPSLLALKRDLLDPFRFRHVMPGRVSLLLGKV